MLKTIKATVLSGALIASVLLTSACGAGVPSTTAAAALKPARIAVGLDPTYALVYVAQEQGYFKKHGVDAALVQTEGGPSMIQAVSGGQADFAYGTDLTSVSNMGANPDLVSLGVVGQSNTNFFTVFSKNIKAASDIKTMAVVPGSAAYMTDKYLKSQGIDPKSIHLVTAAFPDIPAIINRGDADATIAIQPWADRIVAQAGGKIVGDIGDYGAYYALWLSTSNKWLATHQDEAAGVFGALQDASKYVQASPNEAAALTAKKLGMPTEEALRVLKSTDFTFRDFSVKDAEQVKSATEFFVSQGKIKAGPTDSQILKGWYPQHVK